MEIAAAIELGIGKIDEMNRGIKALRHVKPINKPVAGSAIVQAGVSPTIIRATNRVGSGRVWNILSAGIYGADPHSPVGPPQATPTGGFSNGASAAAPAANTQIAPLNLPPGVWDIYVTTLPSGTLAAGDNSNLKLVNVTAGATIVPVIPMDATTANSGTNSGPFQVQLSAQSTIAAEPIANATAGSVYTVSLTAVPVGGQFTTNVIADLYAGQVPDPMTPAFTDLFDSAVPVPISKDYSKGVYWANMGDEVFALVFNANVGQQLVFVCNVDEYPIDSVQAMEIS